MRVGVLGAGTMGAGVAQCVAGAGHQVVLVDNDPLALQNSLQAIERGCRMSRLLTGTAVDPREVMARIESSLELSQLKDCDLVVENVTENWEVKKGAYEELSSTCRPDAVFVVNTSAIPISRVASLVDEPSRVVGVHFMNPVPLKPAVELIRGSMTSDRTVKTVTEFLESIEKRPIAVNDSCGFVSNRVLMLTVNEAASLVHEGVADATTVDEVFTACFGHPMGPLATADLIGVDTIRDSLVVLYEHYGDAKFRPCALLEEMTNDGRLGRKSGQGFFRYSGVRQPGRPSPVGTD